MITAVFIIGLSYDLVVHNACAAGAAGVPARGLRVSLEDGSEFLPELR